MSRLFLHWLPLGSVGALGWMASEGLCCNRDKQIDTRSELTTGGLWEYNMEENPILLLTVHSLPNRTNTHTHSDSPPPPQSPVAPPWDQ